MPDFGRRGFLGGAGLLAGAAAGCRLRKDPYAAEKPAVPVERGLRVGSGQAGLELLYHPDRIRSPRRRVGARGENRWQVIAWDEAIAHLASELGHLRAAGEPQTLVLLDGEQAGTTHALWARFLRVFGSPNHVGHGATGFGAMAQAVRSMTRKACLPGYDFERAHCVLLVGTGALESSPHGIHLARAFAGGARPRLLCASPRLPAMAVLVDEWLSIAPDASAALLLGLLHVLLREQLGDESVLEVASGFAPWAERNGNTQPGLRAQLMAEYAPDKIEQRIGIPAARIADLARELVATRPSMVMVDEGMCDDATASAALLVNALLGSINVPGGMLLDPGSPRVDLGEPELDATARSGLRAPPMDGREAREAREGREPGRSDFEASRILALPEAFISGKPYQAKVLLLSYSNPAYAKPGGRHWREGIARVPFVVSFSPFFDESALYADLLLPDHSFFERWDLVVPGRGSRVLSLRQPVVRPLADTQQTGEVILRVARALGTSIASAFPWADYRHAALAGLAPMDEGVLSELESTGVWHAAQGAPDRADDRVAKPGDNLPPLPLFDVRGLDLAASAPTVGDPVRFPFVLVPFRGLGYAEGGMREMAWLRELPLATGNRLAKGDH